MAENCNCLGCADEQTGGQAGVIGHKEVVACLPALPKKEGGNNEKERKKPNTDDDNSQ